jgi:parvulin-like peptidyl-prolyl isomerase
MRTHYYTIFWVLVLLVAAGCTLTPAEVEPSLSIPTDTSLPTKVDTPTPSPTPTEAVDYAAYVNGEGILQVSFDASLLQLEQALADYPDLLGENQQEGDVVLEELVNRTLLAQAAREAGFSADEQLVAERTQQLKDQAGGEEAFSAWLDQNGYTQESFQEDLRLEIEAAWQRDQIAAGIPEEMEQMRARQLLFYDAFQAERIYNQLEAGVPIDQVVQNNDPNDLGYLDWFPRGALLFPELEDVIFSLQPGEHSAVIETEIGYHIFYLIETDPSHPVSTEARLILQEKAVAAWLEQQRQQAEIEVLLP